MKRIFGLLLVVGLVGAAVGTVPAAAATRKKPVKTKMYMHGYTEFGEVDGLDWLVNSAPPMPMNGTKPADGPPSSMQYAWAPWNSQCSGLPLTFPTWVGNLRGTIVGKAKLKAHFLSSPGAATARIWTDTAVFSCNEGYVPPASEVRMDVPAGESVVTFVFKNLKLKARGNVMIEILEQQIDNTSPQTQGRVLYDSASYPTSLTFKCIPARGKSCLPKS